MESSSSRRNVFKTDYFQMMMMIKLYSKLLEKSESNLNIYIIYKYNLEGNTFSLSLSLYIRSYI